MFKRPACDVDSLTHRGTKTRAGEGLGSCRGRPPEDRHSARHGFGCGWALEWNSGGTPTRDSDPRELANACQSDASECSRSCGVHSVVLAGFGTATSAQLEQRRDRIDKNVEQLAFLIGGKTACSRIILCLQLFIRRRSLALPCSSGTEVRQGRLRLTCKA